MNKKNYTVGGLFSGIGGIELGFQQAGGFDVLWGNEIDEKAAITYQQNFDHTLYVEDIHMLNPTDLAPVEILTGGFPCQAFSIAGYRKGFSDPRGNLFFEIVRLIEGMKEKPKALFLENVNNLTGHDKGNTAKVIKETLNALGYSTFWKVLNTADYTEIPQNRERTFIICFRDESIWNTFQDPSSAACSGKFASLFPPEKPKVRKHISEMLEKGKVDDKFYYKKAYFQEELEDSVVSRDTMYQWRRKYVRENKSDMCPTLTANMGTGGHNVPIIKDDYGIRKLTPRECFNLQGFPESYVLPEIANSQLYKQAGNAVTVAMVRKLAEAVGEALNQKYGNQI